jgi:hypothetical protein
MKRISLSDAVGKDKQLVEVKRYYTMPQESKWLWLIFDDDTFVQISIERGWESCDDHLTDDDYTIPEDEMK